ncbi:MAG TPA: hypothetical protein VGH65_07735, partial [Verrucomicrobiaceae bacterium]
MTVAGNLVGSGMGTQWRLRRLASTAIFLVAASGSIAPGAWIEIGDGGAWKTNDAKNDAAQKIKEVTAAGEKLT